MNKLLVLSTVFALTGAAIAQQPAAASASPRASDSALDSAHALVHQAFATPSVSRRIALIEQAIAVLPDADEPHFLISVELQAIGKYEEAEQELVQCLAINADHYLAEFNLGQIRWKQGRTQDALALLDEAEQDASRSSAPTAMLGAIRGRRDVMKTVLAQRDRAQERVTQQAAPVLEMQVKRVGDQPVEDGRQSQEVLASREIGRQVAAMLASIPADARDARMFAEAVVIAAGSVEPALDQASQFAGVALVLDALAALAKRHPLPADLRTLIAQWDTSLEPATGQSIAAANPASAPLDHGGTAGPSAQSWNVSLGKGKARRHPADGVYVGRDASGNECRLRLAVSNGRLSVTPQSGALAGPFTATLNGQSASATTSPQEKRNTFPVSVGRGGSIESVAKIWADLQLAFDGSWHTLTVRGTTHSRVAVTTNIAGVPSNTRHENKDDPFEVVLRKEAGQ